MLLSPKMKYSKIPHKKFMEIYTQVPRACIDLVVVTNEGILYTKRAIQPYLGMWHLPGGGVLFKEPLQHAIDRIAQDELNIEVQIIKQLGVLEYLLDGGKHSITNGFLAKIKSGTPQGSEQGEEIIYSNTVPPNTIPEQENFINQHIDTIQQHFQ